MSDPNSSPARLVRADIRSLRGYAPGEQVNDTIKLNTNESACTPSPAVLQALQNLSERQLQLYPDPQATSLREAAAARFGVSPDQVIAGNGSDDCLTVLYRSHCLPGDTVACPWPSYGLYKTLAALQGVTLAQLPYTDIGPGGSWQLPAGFADTGARLVLVANPNNPSATLTPVEQLRSLADSLGDAILVVDEAYGDFAPTGSSMLPYLDAHPNLIVLRTFSKSYSLAGGRLGLLFAHRDLCAEYRKVKDSYNVNVVTQALGVAALGDSAHLANLVDVTLSGRLTLEQACTSFGWTWAPSAANFLLIDVGPRAAELYAQLKERGILVRYWDTPELRERLRITVGTAAENQTLIAALQDLMAS
ncbi:MAG: histidinol-phosphate transaminase [Planctomycetota bacterium]|jgi:histidinol-phosphate aminotransferase|nr:histidinol-phosphate transaminase [Planctomycetota bacterium]